MPTVLCFDDQTYSLAARIRCLRSHGYSVVIAVTLDAVLNGLAGRPVDAVILNCHENDADRAARLIRQMRPGIPILMLTAFCGLPCQLTDVVTACVGKGESPNELVRQLENLLGRTGEGQTPTD